MVDKNDKYSFLFKGFRKNKFVVSHFDSIIKFSDEELLNANLFFMVLYETRDIFELLKIYNGSTPIIIASDNLRILKKMKNLGCFSLFDLSKKGNLNIGLHECLKQFSL